MIFQVSPERSKTPQSSQLEETAARLSTASPGMTNNSALTANATLPKPVAKSSVDSTAPAEAEERSQLKNNSRTSAETAAATTSLSTTTIPTYVKSTAPPAETASPREVAAAEIASLPAANATAAVGGVPELVPTNDDTPSRTTEKKEATPPPSTTETLPGALAKQATANSKGIADGTVEEGTSPRSRPMKRPIPTPRYVLTTVKVFEEKNIN